MSSLQNKHVPHLNKARVKINYKTDMGSIPFGRFQIKLIISNSIFYLLFFTYYFFPYYFFSISRYSEYLLRVPTWNTYSEKVYIPIKIVME